jgi:hypothetical protein
MLGAVAALAVLTYCVVIPAWERLRGPLATRAVLTSLGRPVRLEVEGRLSLADFLGSVERASRGPIPVSIDVNVMNAVGAGSMSSIAVSPGLTPARRRLEDALTPLGLSYFVQDGVLIVTSVESAERALKGNKGARRH